MSDACNGRTWPAPTFTPDGLPIIPKIPPSTPSPSDGAVAVCGECGLRIMPVMGYVCPNSRCPTGLGGARW